MRIKFYGGSLDGQAKDWPDGAARSIWSASTDGNREEYERDRSKSVRNADGSIVELAYVFARSVTPPRSESLEEILASGYESCEDEYYGDDADPPDPVI